MKHAIVLTVVVAALAGCALEAPDPAAGQRGCPVAGQARMTMLKMYFGRAAVSDVQWNEFRDRVIADAFPDGFTVYDAEGAWRPGPSAATGHERASVLEVALPRGADVGPKATQVAEAYKSRFAQLSVGVVTWTVCGGF
jgi:hypothetical protein